MTGEQRRRCMSRIRGRDTKPELVVRRWLWRQGYRYRLYVKSLPGRPDIVMRKWRTVIFVNGCFWHGHKCQRHRPATNAQFWQDKITRNHERDERNQKSFHSHSVTSCKTGGASGGITRRGSSIPPMTGLDWTSRTGSTVTSFAQNDAASNVLPLRDMMRLTMSIRCQAEK